MDKGVKAFYGLTNRRTEIEREIESLDNKISELREKAKKLQKGSVDRLNLMVEAQSVKDSNEYVRLKAELDMLNFCINTVFYS